MENTKNYIVCHKQVCKIVAIENNNYILKPVDDNSLILQVPIDSKILRDLINKKDIEKLLKEIPNIEIITDNDRLIEQTYKNLMHNGSFESLVKIIKTTYIRNENRKKNKKKLSEIDEEYFIKAESYLYNELSIVLNLSFEETKDYVIKRVSELINN